MRAIVRESSNQPIMSSNSSAKFNVHDRRALCFLALAAQLWIACSDASSPSSGDQPASAGAAGSAEEGGNGGHEIGPDGTAGQKSVDPTAGRPSSGGQAGAIEPEQAGGAAGLDEAGGAGGTGGTGGTGEVESAGASGSTPNFVPAPHAAFPLVVRHGGPLIKNIELVPVYFGKDPLFDELERFNTWIVGSQYWKQVGAEYGVEPGTRLPPVQFEPVAAASISDTEIASWLSARVADGSLPKPSANTVFALFYQAATTITSGTATSCVEFGALHESVSVANPVFTGDIAFAIIPRCSYSAGDELMIATDVASHEYMEAATCPLPLSRATWFMENASGPLEAWWMLGGPEVADLCLNQSYDMIDGFAVNDIWSNVAAQAGNNPCQPSDPQHPFFSVSADETIYHAQPGATLTIHALAWSNKPAPNWELGVNWGLVPDSDFDGQATLSQTLVNNGDEVTATVTVPAHPPMVNGRSLYRFTIDSIDPINPNFSHPWPFLVIVP